ncbi:FAD binding domain-containing protein [Dyadobacter arcticus]|uniref:Xanthine dehydrogenase YagS FAD-binding subunit n=1 Tax=Dyadobacter arcticus TaxID=1078754 RepID=A0ABX0UIG3_9BACT|nr:xanthine dehydrogenase family protein subunit M [Dyadobacter arcticus]NIJ52804.1 xanthine dehydrogenase YagS FAD-binding subunit [Dyadobacter arcticus]
MRPYQYYRPRNLKEAIDIVSSEESARFIAGGTNLVDLMKRGIAIPEKLVDINHLPLKKIEQKAGILRIGALALNSEVAENKIVKAKYPLLVQALNAGASGQIRNMATVGGNLLQRTRCTYFYDTAFACNKRKNDTGCSALGGINNMHAIFGLNEKQNEDSCIAVNPSDLNVALAALDAVILVMGMKGERRIAFKDFHRLPGERPDLDTNLERGELILGVELSMENLSKHSHYLKVRDRAAYAFAIVSAAVALDIDQGTIKAARLALGGVAHKPWRLYEGEKMLVGQPVSDSVFKQVAEISMLDARSFEHNAFKMKLVPNVIVEALKIAAGRP